MAVALERSLTAPLGNRPINIVGAQGAVELAPEKCRSRGIFAANVSRHDERSYRLSHKALSSLGRS